MRFSGRPSSPQNVISKPPPPPHTYHSIYEKPPTRVKDAFSTGLLGVPPSGIFRRPFHFSYTCY